MSHNEDSYMKSPLNLSASKFIPVPQQRQMVQVLSNAHIQAPLGLSSMVSLTSAQTPKINPKAQRRPVDKLLTE